MDTLAIRFDPTAVDVQCDQVALRVVLADGRELTVPTEWFPRLRDATPAALANWRLIGRGQGIRWPEVDEDLSVTSLMRLS
jgi:hypothetical protein